jgi:hypothetical protein
MVENQAGTQARFETDRPIRILKRGWHPTLDVGFLEVSEALAHEIAEDQLSFAKLTAGSVFVVGHPVSRIERLIARAMRHHIRAVAYAAKGETAKAREEQRLFREAAKKPAKGATFGNNKAADLFAVGDDMLEGEILVREGKLEAGIKALRSAIAKEDKLR